MLKIGDMSRAAQVTVKTLRHYDRLGLFRPAWVDRFTGYRYYRLEQLADLHRILALKDLGLSLDEVRLCLDQAGDIERLNDLLRGKADALRETIRLDRMRLARIEGRLASLNERSRSEHAVVLKALPAQWVVGWRRRLPDYDAVSAALREMPRLAGATWELRDGPPLVIYADDEREMEGLDVELALPLPAHRRARAEAVGDGVLHRLSDCAQAACALCPGGIAVQGEVHIALNAWIESGGYRRIGPIRQVCLPTSAENASMEAGQFSELQYPVEHIRFKRSRSVKEPMIVSQEAFAVVGMLYHGKNENHEIPAMWGRLGPRMDEIRHRSDEEAYGVCFAMDADGAFDYVAGLAVSSSEDVPAGMVYREVPAGNYARFECSLPTIGQAYDYAFKTWLPASQEWEHVTHPDFELYPADYDPDDLASKMYIFVPLRKKQ